MKFSVENFLIRLAKLSLCVFGKCDQYCFYYNCVHFAGKWLIFNHATFNCGMLHNYYKSLSTNITVMFRPTFAAHSYKKVAALSPK